MVRAHHRCEAQADLCRHRRFLHRRRHQHQRRYHRVFARHRKDQWISQVEEKDNFVMGRETANCPEAQWTGLRFRHLGRSCAISAAGSRSCWPGQKSGILWGLDPDQKGKIVWQIKLGAGSALGGIEWGHAADNQYAYVAISDRIARTGAQPGISAVNFDDRQEGVDHSGTGSDLRGSGRLHSGPGRGGFRDPGARFLGRIERPFPRLSTPRTARSCGISTQPPASTPSTRCRRRADRWTLRVPTIANGMVLTNSGYGQFGGKAGNVLLAFSVDGK